MIDKFPVAKKVVVVMSGGMDSAIAARLSIEKYGADNVSALSFYYQQKQSIELDLAKHNCEKLGISHTLIDISFLGDIARPISANINQGLDMPTIVDILGDPAPITEVPFRNSILLMIAASYAQVNNCQLIVTGIQAQDEYSYWDTTKNFIDKMNSVLVQNRMHNIQIFAPFQGMNKKQEIEELLKIENINFLESTITCYNPDHNNKSCGACPSCAERIAAFAKIGVIDPIDYQHDICWESLFLKYKE